MSRVILNFYDEKITIQTPATFEELKLHISQQFYLNIEDVEELLVYYIDGERRVYIANEDFYRDTIKASKANQIQIYLEVSEKSKLYQRELESSKVLLNPQEEKKEPSDSINEEREKLLRDIQEKERLLKEILAKEAAEKERKIHEDKARKEKVERERKEKAEEEAKRLKSLQEAEEKKKRMEQDRMEREKMLLELKEQEDKLKKQLHEELLRKKEEKEIKLPEVVSFDNTSEISVELKEDIRKSVCELIDKNLERVKEELCEQTVNQAFRLIDSKVSNAPKVTTVHHGFHCDGCGMFPIVGIRYRCHTCPDFDFCETCEQLRGEEHGHPLIKYRNECKFRSFGGRCEWRNKGEKMLQKVMDLFKPKEEPKCEVSSQEPKEEVPKDEQPSQGQYAKLAEEIFSNFELPNISVKDVESALEKTKGMFDEAIELLYKNLK
jgi:hypothetical protein